MRGWETRRTGSCSSATSRCAGERRRSACGPRPPRRDPLRRAPPRRRDPFHIRAASRVTDAGVSRAEDAAMRSNLRLLPLALLLLVALLALPAAASADGTG